MIHPRPLRYSTVQYPLAASEGASQRLAPFPPLFPFSCHCFFSLKFSKNYLSLYASTDAPSPICISLSAFLPPLSYRCQFQYQSIPVSVHFAYKPWYCTLDWLRKKHILLFHWCGPHAVWWGGPTGAFFFLLSALPHQIFVLQLVG